MPDQDARPKVNRHEDKVMQKMAVLNVPNEELYIGSALAKELTEKHDGQILQRFEGKIYKMEIKEAPHGGFHVGWVEHSQVMMVDQFANYWLPKKSDMASSSARDRSRSPP
jgi:hypothetical protein